MYGLLCMYHIEFYTPFSLFVKKKRAAFFETELLQVICSHHVRHDYLSYRHTVLTTVALLRQTKIFNVYLFKFRAL